ncbi:GPW/gp25 family protein [Nocardia aurea]|uniref:GPW/gp25 family protein n=1 Tax=Nocardia aurea TaxID=2144174 RepID=A0ABV3G1M2_9NOCA
MSDPDVYGRGVSWPFRLGLSGVAESSGVARVEESIRILLGTRRGERAMRPDFGCDLGTLVFAPNNTATANLARFHVEDCLRKWEPRIELVEVRVDNDNHNGLLLVTVIYRLRASAEVRNLVYPFSLERVR